MEKYKELLASVGWFIPPYVTRGFIAKVSSQIEIKDAAFNQTDLEILLDGLYSPLSLSAMVSERYPVVPYIQDYSDIIAECVSAHFLGLNHIAVSGLIPVIEGAGKKIAQSRGVKFKSINSVFDNLAKDCITDVKKNSIGAVSEIVVMLESFNEFTKNALYIDSNNYIFSDKTNRHGILHGAYGDGEYNSSINFFKTVACIDFLCFISALKSDISFFAPEPTKKSNKIYQFYLACKEIQKFKPK